MVKHVEEVPIFGAVYRGVVQAVKTLKSKKGSSYLGVWLDSPSEENRVTVFVFGEYFENLQYLKKGDQLLLLNVEVTEGKLGGKILTVRNNSIVVVDPDYLISVQLILDAKECPRRAYVKIMGAEPPVSNPHDMIRGTLVHSIHTRWLLGQEEYGYIVADTLMKKAHDLIIRGIDIDEVYAMLLTYEGAMGEEIDPDLDESVTFLNPIFGIRGEIDVLTQNRILELKSKKESAKVPYQPWRRDVNQAILYGASAVLHHHDYELIVRYLHPIQGLVDYPVGTLKKYQNAIPGLIRARNLVWFMIQERFIPRPLEEDSQACEYCFVKEGCYKLCSGLEQFRSCTTCALQDECSQKAWGKLKQEFYVKYTSALLEEERHVNSQLRELWLLEPEDRVKAGNALRLDKLIEDWEPVEGNMGVQVFQVNNTSILRKGEPVIISYGKPIQERYLQGRIKDIYKDKIELLIPKPAEAGMFVDRSSAGYLLSRDRKAIFQFLLMPDGAQWFLHNIFFESDEKRDIERVGIDSKALDAESLNPSQYEAVKKALGASPVHVIKGPPGTGKTHVIGEIIRQYIQRGARVLAIAYTNTAVDNMIKKFLELTPERRLLRLGNESSIDESLWEFSLQSKPVLEAKTALETAQVVFATTSKINSFPELRELLDFDVVIIDEASQITIPGVLGSIRQASRFVLVGDDKQLPAVITSVHAKEVLSPSLFSYLVKELDSQYTTLLEYQYRMNERIMEFPSQRFYQGRLKPASTAVAMQSLVDLGFDLKRATMVKEFLEILDPAKPIVGVHILSPPPGREKYNPYEVEVVAGLVRSLIDGGIYAGMIGVISPFRAQVSALRARLPSDVSVDTVDRFQGSDREVIIFSSVNGTDLKPVNFITDEKRFNVSITRAKKKLIVIATSTSFYTLAELLREYFQFTRSQDAYFTFKKKPFFSEPISTIIVTKALIPIREMQGKFSCFLCGKKTTGRFYQCPVCGSYFHGEHLEEYVHENGECPVCKESMQLTDYYYKEKKIQRVVRKVISHAQEPTVKSFSCWSCGAMIERGEDGFPGYCTQCGAMVTCMLCRQPLFNPGDVISCPNKHAGHRRGVLELKKIGNECPVCKAKF